ncbi:signal recognition particle-docking protein FtsY [Oribacterium sp. WCC10]|uniref:signal recognition particle-docking protein FtsY n=1 Tax=Oribacterium sp. WCC10 TaxID=1855343 RepID=UPI0008E43CB4|nr:signal recognition particle-docking protein FtsY [Oribacterium sp. WCC10]SFG08998.1 fused signal recognition particle receptor [Oribacterium sp. WCC10]
MANFFSKLINNIFQSNEVADDAFYEDLEDAMIMSDVGVTTTLKVIDAVKTEASRQGVNTTREIKKILRDYLYELMRVDDSYYDFEKQKSIISVIGVNGVGKTTSIGKLAKNFKDQNKRVILAAADTFRAGAIEQLKEWGNRIDVDVIAQKEGSDPAAVVFDALQSFKRKNADLLIIDTAGRLHNKKNLMQELGKINRIIDKEFAEGYRETLVVLDATTGQNAMSQAEIFKDACEVTGIILTKMDGTAKGGIALAVQSELGLPVKYIGVGEKASDLRRFDSKEYVDSIFED